MPYYMFYWGSGDEDERFLMRIEADNEKVKCLLNEYRESDPEEYNDADFEDFLKNKGINAEIISPDEWIHF